MSEESRLTLKRARQTPPSSRNVEKRPRLAEEKISSSRKRRLDVVPCPSKSIRAPKRAFLSEGQPRASSKKRQKKRGAWSDSEKYTVERQTVDKSNLCIDPKVQDWFNKKELKPISYSPISSDSSLLATEGGETDHSEFIKKIGLDHHLANYDLGDVIGCGSFGQVVAATRKTDGMPVAIKFVSKESVRELKEIKGRRIPAEAYLQNKAQHRYVIKIYEVFTTEQHYVYVMERPEMCKDLFDILQLKVTLSEREARRYFSHILEANISCEENGVIHRDLKPENILVDLRNDEAKLIDFGLASEVQDEPFVKFRGTNAYTPPEYLSTGKYDGCPGTVWQMGILLAEILSPIMAFDKPEQALKMAPRIPEHLSSEVKNLISSLLNTVPMNRPTLKEVLQHPWFTMQD